MVRMAVFDLIKSSKSTKLQNFHTVYNNCSALNIFVCIQPLNWRLSPHIRSEKSRKKFEEKIGTYPTSSLFAWLNFMQKCVWDCYCWCTLLPLTIKSEFPIKNPSFFLGSSSVAADSLSISYYPISGNWIFN